MHAAVCTPDTTSAEPTLLERGEQLMSFSAAAKASRLPSHRGNATHVNASTLYRWAVKGWRTPGGQTIRLEAIKAGPVGWRTSVEAVHRFVQRLTEAALPSDPPAVQPATTPKQRERMKAKAHAQADAIFGNRKK